MGLSSPVMIGVALCCTNREETSASCGAVITGMIYYGGMDQVLIQNQHSIFLLKEDVFGNLLLVLPAVSG